MTGRAACFEANQKLAVGRRLKRSRRSGSATWNRRTAKSSSSSSARPERSIIGELPGSIMTSLSSAKVRRRPRPGGGAEIEAAFAVSIGRPGQERDLSWIRNNLTGVFRVRMQVSQWAHNHLDWIVESRPHRCEKGVRPPPFHFA